MVGIELDSLLRLQDLETELEMVNINQVNNSNFHFIKVKWVMECFLNNLIFILLAISSLLVRTLVYLAFKINIHLNLTGCSLQLAFQARDTQTT